MDTTILMGSSFLANSGGTPMTTQGGLSPCRDLMISTNPGGVQHWLTVSFCSDSTFTAGETNGLAAQAVAVGFDCPMPWPTANAPLA